MSLEINNRRYIGSKTSLLNEIDSVVMKYMSNYNFTFADIFGGTGVVANYFYNKGCHVIVNDLLKSNYIAYHAWMSNEPYDQEKIDQFLEKYNKVDSHKLEGNYFSTTFGGKYYNIFDAKKIGYIREQIENSRKTGELTPREYSILLASLMYSADKIAHTCGHFESFLKTEAIERGVQLQPLNIIKSKGASEIFCEDANKLVKNIEADVVYIDPPYNARQYVNFYHVLENLILWQKPTDLEGNSMKFKRNHLKSDYSKAKAPIVFKDLIDNIKCKYIIVSYNNTYNARSGASNNKISEEQLLTILGTKGIVHRVDIDYKFFNAGKTDFNDHKEFLYICEVK